jgi:TRAP-type C4-dicarboxylate transport system permease small subunit
MEVAAGSPSTGGAPGALRRSLDALYDGSAALAGVFMVLLLVMVMSSILGRQLHFDLAGADAYAGYMMAASGFLALAHTLKKGEHIRVTLLISALGRGWKRGFEIWALLAATLLSVLFAFYSVKLAWQSHVFHDISTGNDATPLWLPQTAMALGAIVLAVAFVDELVLEIRGARVIVESEEAMHNE